MNKHMFIDAETDGLYGPFLSIAAIVCDSFGEEESVYYACRRCSAEDIKEEWVLENVFPYLNSDKVYDTEQDLLSSFWEFYMKHKECICIGDVIYPVECRLFESCVRVNLSERSYQGPYPLLDLSSMLYARGLDPLIERTSLVDGADYISHYALDDVRMSIAIWKQYIR